MRHSRSRSLVPLRDLQVPVVCTGFLTLVDTGNKTPFKTVNIRSELSYLAPLGNENISAPYFKQCFFGGGVITPQTESNTTPPSPKTEITNILFYILNL